MGISWQWVRKFAEANLACAVDVHMNSDVPFFWDVVEVQGGTVKLQSHNGGEVITRRIGRTRSGTEQVSILHSGAYEDIFGTKPTKVFLQPFNGRRI